MVNFGPLAAKIVSLVWCTPGNFNGFRVLAALLHGTIVVGVSQTTAGRPSRWALAHILVCIDFTGPLSPPSDGYRWILTIIDMCTRFPECIPLRDISSSSVAEALLGIFSRVGLPDRIHSDRGSQFTSETRMWANAQPDGRPAERSWRPMFNAAVWLTPTTRCGAVMLQRCETRWNL